MEGCPIVIQHRSKKGSRRACVIQLDSTAVPGSPFMRFCGTNPACQRGCEKNALEGMHRLKWIWSGSSPRGAGDTPDIFALVIPLLRYNSGKPRGTDSRIRPSCVRDRLLRCSGRVVDLSRKSTLQTWFARIFRFVVPSPRFIQPKAAKQASC